MDLVRRDIVNERLRQKMVKDYVPLLFSDLTVKHGPFKGMIYPSARSTGSSLFPKLLGSYEQELRPIIETACRIPYTEIVDIGCAEGYYAVGFARRSPSVKVFAFDTNSEAISYCREMAVLNGVSERVITGGFCSPAILMGLPLTAKALIICDCEGYEKELFSKQVIRHLSKHDLLIEVHDCIDIEISTVLVERFSDTYRIEEILSTDDTYKARKYHFPELEGFSLHKRREILAENRSGIMSWFYLTPKN
ncbi:MAG: class I SAM-dependent methyltransferase [Bacteroidetes bacterium]|nr:class I SAM-dependent methyltransferase [Bacteroidota bacterium]